MIHYYCIPSCDKCRTARKLLTQKEIAHSEINMRKDGIPTDTIQNWVQKYGLEAILNRRSTVWRGLSVVDQEQIETDPIQMGNYDPAILKRPILDFGDEIKTQKSAIEWLEAQS